MSQDQAGVGALLQAIARTRVCVVGDVLLDVFTRGSTDRVCPDAPALVVREHDVTYRASGAAIAAQSLRALGANVHLLTVLGNDDAGRRARHLITADATTLTAVRADRPTACKNRIIAVHPAADGAAGQLLLRVDREDTTDIPAPIEAELLAAVQEAIDHADAVLLSDYAKGVCTASLTRAVIEAARSRGIPVIVDPKHPDPHRYTGATVLTPNRPELMALTGPPPPGAGADPAGELADRLRVQAGADWVVATLDREGISAVGPGGAHLTVPAYPAQIVDVAGAGDVFAAVLAAVLGASAGLTPQVLTAGVVLGSLAAGLSLRQEAHKQIPAADLLTAAAQHALLDVFADLVPVDLEVQ